MPDQFDYVIVGQGLAGTTLAWHLRWAGFRAVVIDREAPVTSSRIAAGLITPITGRRLAPGWRYDELYPAAVAFYRRVEAETRSHFFTTRPVMRLFRDDRERSAADSRGLVSRPGPSVNPDWFAAPFGGFEMTAAGQLAVARYLDVSREHFAHDGGYRTGMIARSDVELGPDGVRFPRFGLAARGVVFCQGVEGIDNPWFPRVRFAPAKGEILTVRVPGLAEDRVVNRGVWLAPVGGDVFRVGATYDRDTLDGVPTPRGREELCGRLRGFLRRPFDVIGHAAAVRPITDGRTPVLGLHPGDDRIGYFNGLGSKGSLVAPYFAGRFVGLLTGGGSLDPEVDVRRFV